MSKRSSRGVPVVSVTLAVLALGLAAVGRGQTPRATATQVPKASVPQVPKASVKDSAKVKAPDSAKAKAADSAKEKAPESAKEKAPDIVKEKGPPQPGWTTVAQCFLCHRETSKGQPVTDFVSLKEVDIWTEKDKHKQAFEVLKSDDSKRMGGLLGLQDVSKEGRCLSCHAPAASTPEVDAEAIAEGVSCVSCHGAYSDWVTAHHGLGNRKVQEEWIRKTGREKQKDYGMNDLRDPAVRAQVCASCHVGDAKQGRVVTHDMYAAGHPPLPGLEVATFSEAEPPHWWPMKDVPYLKKATEALKTQYGIDQAATQHAKLVAVGGVVAFREAMDLFAETAKPSDGQGVPDFARFDCASCHHELAESSNSWRQARGFASDPGRPPIAAWPAALISIGIEAADPDRSREREDTLLAGLRRLHKAVGAKPFGDPDTAVDEARRLSAWADTLAGELNASKLDRDGSIRMLRRITTLTPPDHASARQLVWGFRAIYNELDPKPDQDKAISATIAQLMNTLGINLTPGKQGTIEREVGARLDADDKFDPRSVREAFGRLGSMLR